MIYDVNNIIINTGYYADKSKKDETYSYFKFIIFW